MAIKLSTGNVPFDIEFDNGKKGTIYFNPTDSDLMVRLSNAYNNIENRLKELEKEDVILNNDGSVKLPDDIDDYENLTDEQKQEFIKHIDFMTSVLQDTRDIVCNEINKVFASDVSSVVFKYCSPLAVINGEFMVVQFLNAIAPEIKKYIDKANKEAEKKKQKHIGKYQKK